MRLRDRPGGHEAAGAPTEDRQAIGIGPALRNGKIGGAVYVGVSAIAKVLVDGVEKIGAVASGAAILRLQHDVAHARNQPRKNVEVEGVVGFWTAVRENEERV